MVLPASRPAGVPDLALLARADWRFLLPVPPEGGLRHLVLLGGPEGLADMLLAAGFARRVSRVPTGPGTADAVAVLDSHLSSSLPSPGIGPGAATAPGTAGGLPWSAREAAVCLEPGGVLYCEFRGGARPGLPACLQATGLYAVWPRFAGARAWVPLGPPGALPWFLDNVFPASTPRKRTVAQVLAALPDPRRAAGLLTRCFALTASAGPRRGAAASLLEHPDLAPAVRRGEPAPILLSHGRERVVLAPFRERLPAAPAAGDESEAVLAGHRPQVRTPVAGAGRPSVVLKVPRLPRFNQVGEEEQAVLRRIRSGLPAALAAALPHPQGVLRAGTLAVAIESCAPGRSLLRSTGAWGASVRRRVRDLELATSWLGDFHRAGELARGPWTGRETESWVAAPLDAFRRRFGATAAEERLFALTLERAAALAGVPVPTVWQHRDFTPWNLLREGDRLAVIDWEGARPGPPLSDLLHFATHWHQVARGVFDGEERAPARLAAFRELFVTGAGERYAGAARLALAGYRGRLGLDARLQPVLLVTTWAELAVRRAGHASHAGDAVLRQAIQETAFVAALAAGAGAVFGGGGEP